MKRVLAVLAAVAMIGGAGWIRQAVIDGDDGGGTGDRVRLRCGSDLRAVCARMAAEDDSIVISVEDEGPGVPEAEREAVFRRFQSIRPSTEAFGQHSGLGLASARTIVEGHGGAISVEARQDGATGARFVVRLPLAESR